MSELYRKTPEELLKFVTDRVAENLQSPRSALYQEHLRELQARVDKGEIAYKEVFGAMWSARYPTAGNKRS